MAKKNDLPAMMFYVGDWRKAPEIRALPLDARALWFEMLCLMWEMPRRGYLSINGKDPIDDLTLSRMIGEDVFVITKLKQVLQQNDVFSVEEETEIIFNRRMVRDEEIRVSRSIAGTKGMKHRYSKDGVCYNKPPNKKLTPPEDEYEDEDDIKKIGGAGGKKKTPQAEFVEKFVAHYEQNTGHKYKAGKKDFVIVANLIKQYGVEAVQEKANYLATYCSGKVEAWFAKDGWADFTIGKLSSNWNNLIPKLTKEQKDRIEMDRLYKLEEERAERIRNERAS